MPQPDVLNPILLALAACPAEHPLLYEEDALELELDPEPDAEPSVEAPWVYLDVYDTPARVGAPVRMAVRSGGVESVQLTTPGGKVRSWEEATRGWWVTAAFQGQPGRRVVRLDGFDEQGEIVASYAVLLELQPGEITEFEPFDPS